MAKGETKIVVQTTEELEVREDPRFKLCLMMAAGTSLSSIVRHYDLHVRLDEVKS